MKTRVWYNAKMVDAKAREFDEKYGKLSKEEIVTLIKDCDYKVYRLICNALADSGYHENALRRFDYIERHHIQNALNERANTILGEHAELYNTLIKSQRHELWNGDERYKLFGYDLGPYADRQVIKTMVIFIVEFLGQPLTAENLGKIASLYNHGPFWTLVPEPKHSDTPNWETNDKDFATVNNHRQTECEAWYTFMNHVFNKDYEKAYAIMKRYGSNK